MHSHMNFFSMDQFHQGHHGQHPGQKKKKKSSLCLLCSRLVWFMGVHKKRSEEEDWEECEEILHIKMSSIVWCVCQVYTRSNMSQYGEQPASCASQTIGSAFVSCSAPCSLMKPRSWHAAKLKASQFQQCQPLLATVIDCRNRLVSVPPACGVLVPIWIPMASFARPLQFGFSCE